MQMNSQDMINDLQKRVIKAAETVSKFRTLSYEQINARKATDDWSLLECIEHLNIYGNFYLPEIENQLLANKGIPASTHFKSGIIGNYFVNLVQVKNAKQKKMKTLAAMNPNYSDLSITTIERFLKQTEMLLGLLELSKKTNIVKIKTSNSIYKIIFFTI